MTATVRFGFGDVVVEDASRFEQPGGSPVFARWPCPGCGSRQLLDDAWRLMVRDAYSGGHPREIVVCASCYVGSGLHTTIS